MKVKVLLTYLAALWLMLWQGASGATESVTYFHLDALGSPVAATDGAGRIKWSEHYKPYGDRAINELAATTNTRWYTGHPHDDDTGLTYMGARYYDPSLGRFMAIDPAPFTEENPHSLNRYAYANNNPYRYVDPDGRNAVTAFGGLLYETGQALSGKGFDGSMVMGALADGYNGGGREFAGAAIQDATAFIAAGASIKLATYLSRATNVEKGLDPNKLKHLFGQERHNLSGVVKQFGSEEKAFNAIQQATERAVGSEGLKGVFETTVKVGTETITVRGNVIDGAVKIGTAFVP